MMRYRVTLPIEIDGVIYHYGDVIRLEMETAVQYSHALIGIEEDKDGRDKQRL